MVLPFASRLCSLALLASFIVGCTCSNDLVTPREKEPLTRADLRIVHASADAPELSCRQNDKDFMSMIRYDAPVSAYKELPSELRNLRFMTQSESVVLSLNVQLEADKNYSFILLDRAARMRGLLMDDQAPDLPPGRSAFRIVHADDLHHTITVVGDGVNETLSFAQASNWLPCSPGAAVNIQLDQDSFITIPPSLLVDGVAITAVIRPADGSGEALIVM